MRAFLLRCQTTIFRQTYTDSGSTLLVWYVIYKYCSCQVLSAGLCIHPCQVASPGDPIEVEVVAQDQFDHDTSAFLDIGTVMVGMNCAVSIHRNA